MPTAESMEPGSGRVTRSLRKRLTSIDSDASIRPVTPNLNPLVQIKEAINTPTKRLTRRVSLSTPSKETPAKDTTNTPVRRLTRRRSTNVSDTEEQTIQTVSKSPAIDAVVEEPDNESQKDEPKRALRSSSRSPNNPENDTKKTNGKKTPKSKKQVPEESEECKLNISAENENSKKPNGKKQKSNSTEIEKHNEEVIEKEKSRSENDSVKLSTKEHSSPLKNKTPLKSTAPDKTKTPKSTSKQSKTPKKEKSPTTSPLKSTTKKNKSTSSVNETDTKESSPSKIPSSPAKTQESSAKSPLKKIELEPLKTVVFDASDDEDSEKCVYPKTPGLIKSKSYILDSTSEADKDVKSSKNNLDSDTDTDNDNDKDEKGKEIGITADRNTKTPYKLKKLAVESSTPIQQNNSPKKEKSMEKKSTDIIKQKQNSSNGGDIVFSEEDDDETNSKEVKEKDVSFPKNWTQSVSGTNLNSSKIDRIVSEKSLLEKETEKANESNKSHNNSKTKSPRLMRRKLSSDDDDMLEEDDDYESHEGDEEENGEQNAEKSVFIDEEAMEVADGEESMDSEEREYLEQNEIPTYGESIGSEDTEEDEADGINDEEPDEEDDAFVVSDSEVIEDALSSDEDLDGNRKSTKKRQFKRVIQHSESSEEGDKKKDDTDFCLMVDSSFENEKADQSKADKSLKATVASDIHNKSVNSSKIEKLEILEQVIVMTAQTEEEPLPEISTKSPEKKESEKSEKSVKNSSIINKDFESINEQVNENIDDNESENKSVKKSRKSSTLVEQESKNDIQNHKESGKSSSFIEHDSDDAKKDLNAEENSKKRKASLGKSRKSIIRTSTEEAHEEQPEEVPPENLNVSKKSRKSITQAHEEQSEKASPENLNISKKSKKSRKSSDRNSLSQNETDDNPEMRTSNAQQSYVKNCNQSTDSESEKVSLNVSKKLKKSTLNEEPDTRNKSSQQTQSIAEDSAVGKDCYEFDDEEEEKVTLNVSKKSRKSSLCKAKPSAGEEKSPHRKSMPQQENAKENSDKSDESEVCEEPNSEEEKTALNISKKSRKSSQSEVSETKQRKSTSQENVQKELDESADSEKEKLSLNLSKKSRISLGDLPNKAYEKSPQKKSIETENTSNKDSDDSIESGNEKPMAELPREVRQRRKSISQQNASIINKSSESEDEPEEEDKSSSETTDDECQFSDDEENPLSDKAMSSFLGETPSGKEIASRRKSIIAANESKLDETFQLDPKACLSSSMHENLHRSLLRKSLNQSQMRRQSIINHDANTGADDSSSESQEQDEEEIQVNKNVIAEKGLSVSLNSIQIKKKKIKDTKVTRNSFTIGVSLRMNKSSDEETLSTKEDAQDDASSSENENSIKDDDDDDEDDSENKPLNESEEEVLEKVKNVQTLGPYKSRKSMSSSILQPPYDTETKQSKKTKRSSLCLQENTASNSFIENLAEERKKIKLEKRKSKSFCGVAEVEEDDVDVEAQPQETRSAKKLKKSSESSDCKDVKHVLDRCEQLLAAANEAKLQAKLQAKKVKVKKPKRMDKGEKEKEDEVKIPMVSKKEIKRKEKIKKELEKALKHSAKVLTGTVETATKTKKKNASLKPKEDYINPSKRLEAEFLESLVKLSKPTKKKSKVIETTPPSDKENSKKKSKKPKYKIEDIEDKKSEVEMLETACGTVVVEPSTPQKLRVQRGFRESPKTPSGFKIEDINSNKKKSDKVHRELKLSSDSGEKLSESKGDKKKRKRKHLSDIKEPTYVLPKTQWTSSGVFVEEDLSNPLPLANSTATQFLLASLDSTKKKKTALAPISGTTMSSAMSFKSGALSNKKHHRQKSKEILFAKQRKIVNEKF